MRAQRNWFGSEAFLEDFDDSELDEFFQNPDDSKNKKIYVAA